MITRQLKITPYHDDTIHIIVYFTVYSQELRLISLIWFVRSGGKTNAVLVFNKHIINHDSVE